MIAVIFLTASFVTGTNGRAKNTGSRKRFAELPNNFPSATGWLKSRHAIF
jgi:hypothetical protein